MNSVWHVWKGLVGDIGVYLFITDSIHNGNFASMVGTLGADVENLVILCRGALRNLRDTETRAHASERAIAKASVSARSAPY